ncbi:orotidine-5'-phosphate decarboxylase [Candidatus Peregrinibacteria bacterium]|nr:orotidine-5'-phosphate decarboxylase [Candidatus Peregrinibacteria bacterium]
MTNAKTRPPANQLFKNRWHGKLVCVGLDSNYRKIPGYRPLGSQLDLQLGFNMRIVQETNSLVAAYKLNLAFYLARGEEGVKELRRTIAYIHEVDATIPVILDAKWADIGSTNEGYVEFAFDRLNVDAVTLNPYLGFEALQPFFDRQDKFFFVLCRTSNQGAGEFQDILDAEGRPLYQTVARRVREHWDKASHIGLVVGATYPEELRQVRQIVGNFPLLIPGIGKQGGDLQETLLNGVDPLDPQVLINSSREVIFASNDPDTFAKAAGAATLDLDKKIRAITKQIRSSP